MLNWWRRLKPERAEMAQRTLPEMKEGFWEPLTKDGHIHQFEFVWVKGIHSDAELLRALGLGHFNPVERLGFYHEQAIIADDEDWRVVGTQYSLMHQRDGLARVAVLSGTSDLLYGFVSDIDQSYSFAWHQRGHLIRRLVVDDWPPHHQTVVAEFGERLHGEPAHPPRVDEFIHLMRIAEGIGLKTVFKPQDIRCYQGQQVCANR